MDLCHVQYHLMYHLFIVAQIVATLRKVMKGTLLPVFLEDTSHLTQAQDAQVQKQLDSLSATLSKDPDMSMIMRSARASFSDHGDDVRPVIPLQPGTPGESSLEFAWKHRQPTI